jgi:3-oxoacyl-[acyl-carrier-protein] synthase-3
MPASEETVLNRLHYVKMEGPEIFRFASRKVAEATTQVIAKARLRREDVDLFIPHQANMRIIDSAVRRLGLDGSRVFVNLERYGNTSSASIPMALCAAEAQGRLRPGDTVVMVAVGAGLTWGAAAIQWCAHLAPVEQLANAEVALSTR